MQRRDKVGAGFRNRKEKEENANKLHSHDQYWMFLDRHFKCGDSWKDQILICGRDKRRFRRRNESQRRRL